MKRVAILLVALNIAGCATCQPVTLLRATIEAHSHDLPVQEEHDRVAFKVGPYASLSVGPCVARSVVRGSICISIRIANAQRARFVDTTFTVTDRRSGTTSKFPITQFDYSVICEVSAKGVKSCSSSEEPPVTGAVQMEELHRFTYRDTEHYIRRYSFGASEEFSGAQAKEGPAVWRIFVEEENWREYTAIVVKEPLLGSAYTLSVPALIVGGTKFSIPSIQLETVTEEICHHKELI